jgi:hypothetical protein
MGRKPLGERPLTNAERVKLCRLRKKAGQSPGTTANPKPVKNAGGGRSPSPCGDAFQIQTNLSLPSPVVVHSPVAHQPGPPAPTLPVHVQHALTLLGGKVKSYDEAKELLKDAHVWDLNLSQQRRGYKRPACTYPWQHEIVDATQLYKVTFVEGSRRVGKSNAALLGAVENILNGCRQVDLYGAKKDSAARILRDLRYDQFSYNEIDPVIVDTTAMRVTFANGGIIEAHASVPSDAKGFKSSVIWFEEFDQLLRLQPKVIAAAVGVLLSEPDARLIITANKDTGAFKIFEDMLTKPEFSEDVKFFSINDSQAPHVERCGNTPLVKAFMTATMGADYAEQQIHNQDSYDGEVFNAQGVIDAMETYSSWINEGHKSAQKTVIAVDPGHGHATGIFIAGWYNGHVYELESHEFVGKRLDQKSGSNVSQPAVTEDYLKEFVRGKAREYNADIVCETNSGGAWWMDHWRETSGQRRVRASDFGKDGTVNDRNAFIHVLSQLINEGRFHYKNDRLRGQLISYNPDDRETVEWNNKGDLADACLHATRFLVKYGAEKHKKTTWDGR